jgi:hypothetical protein
MSFLSSFPKVALLLGDRGCDTDWISEALQDKGIPACFSERKQNMKTVKYDKRRWKWRNRIEILFGRSKASRQTHEDFPFGSCSRGQRHRLALKLNGSRLKWVLKFRAELAFHLKVE